VQTVLSPAPTERVEPRVGGGLASRAASRVDRTTFALNASLALGIAHHLDHVIRNNHSGFPFNTALNLFTVSLAAYPMLIAARVLRQRAPLAGAVFAGALFVAMVAGHSLFEVPSHQHGPWSDGTNLSGVNSSVMGVVAVSISMLLMVALAAATASLVIDGVRARGARTAGRAS
jgi:hypothetical protein